MSKPAIITAVLVFMTGCATNDTSRYGANSGTPPYNTDQTSVDEAQTVPATDPIASSQHSDAAAGSIRTAPSPQPLSEREPEVDTGRPPGAIEGSGGTTETGSTNAVRAFHQSPASAGFGSQDSTPSGASGAQPQQSNASQDTSLRTSGTIQGTTSTNDILRRNLRSNGTNAPANEVAPQR